ncbi:MAG: FHA domain-containing protein [Methylovulum sp.]|nr:FHA domain-containing protein [Methylovulum sp.]
MAKLTVFFKYKEIDSYLFENRVVHIGRDETNDVTIDSLAVAPAHAAIIIRSDASTIKQLNDNFPLIINGQKVKEYNLNDKDTITIGKHDIVYNTTETETDPQPEELVFEEGKHLYSDYSDNDVHLQAASLQVLTGSNIGKILPLKKAMTRLGNSGNGVVVISKKKDGYFISALENTGKITVNNIPLNDSYSKLGHNDILAINNVSLQFFLH